MGFKRVPTVELDLSYDKERELNIRLNKNVGEFDYDILANMFDVGDLTAWGFSEKDLKIFSDDDVYSRKIKSPVYKIKNKKPLINEIVDDKKTNELIEKIESSSLSVEDKEFLKMASMRHMVFNYSKIADYYAHSDKETQELMEESALVIIDYDKAIESGFIEMTQYMRDLQLDDK